MEPVKIEINGKEYSVSPEKTILDVVNEYKIDDIPTLCHSPELKPYGSCFVCVVELVGRPNLAPACATRVAAGMKVLTRSDRVVASRKTAFELLVSNHYADCLSPCKLGCPAGVDAQGYIALAAMGQFRKAIDLVRETNPFPAICGRVCVRKCEAVCRREILDEPVGINNVKRFVSDYPGAYDGTPERAPSRGKSIGVVGGGPSGLTAAWFLGRKGYDVVVYEAMKYAGGMLRYGIPEYRLPKAVLDREIEYICRAGAVVKTGVKVGRDLTMEELRQQHQAVYIAAGAWGSKDMGIENEHTTQGVVGGIDFLYEKTEDHTPMKGTIVVVGGGNTAMDVARTSWRLGADKVIILYRRTKAEMPADKMEIEDCIKEGIEILELAMPTKALAENGKLKALRCIRMKLGEPDASGRRRPIPQEGSEFDLPCDMAVAAIGQEPVLGGVIGVAGCQPKVSKYNTITVDTATMKTNIPGVFAGGDVADDGPTVVIDAIRDGQRAATYIVDFLGDGKAPASAFIIRKDDWDKPTRKELGAIPESPRHHVHEISVEERAGNFREVSSGYEHEDMTHEADRCLSCGCLRYDDCKLRFYCEEYHIDINHYKGYVRKHKIDDRHPYVSYDPNKCILCSRCIRTCMKILPISALGLVSRGFKTEMRPAMNDPLAATNCVSCGSCVASCPTGALTVKYPFAGRACLDHDQIETSCGFCSIGCSMKVNKVSDNRYWTEPSGLPGDYLCRYGRFGNDFVIRSRRVYNPSERTGGKRNDVSLETAEIRIAQALQQAKETYGPDAVAVFLSPELSNEEMYLAARIAREGLGTNNVSSLTLIEGGVEAGELDRAFGFTASTADRSVLRDADLIVCNNTDTLNDHLILSVEIMAAVNDRNAKLIISNSSLDNLDKLSSLTVDPMRGRAALLWNGVIQRLIDTGFVKREELSAIKGGKDFLSDNFDYSMKATVAATGVDARKVEATAALIAGSKKIVFVYSPDRAQNQAPGDITALANLTLLLRARGVRADMLLPGVSANLAGVEICGAAPTFKPGRVLADGLNNVRSNAALKALLEEGKLKAALIIGEDPMRSNRTASYFRNIEFLAVIDWAVTETIMYSNVAIPGSTFFESNGTRINFEGKLTRFNNSVTPPSGVPTWKVLADLALKLGIKAEFSCAFEITAAIETALRNSTGSLFSFYWNEGVRTAWEGKGTLNVADTRPMPSTLVQPITMIEKYKKDLRDLGVERYNKSASR
ncbi:MAG: FAD-dependent oxidoreductase [Candidatus Brocadiia bacterium]